MGQRESRRCAVRRLHALDLGLVLHALGDASVAFVGALAASAEVMLEIEVVGTVREVLPFLAAQKVQVEHERRGKAFPLDAAA